MYRQRYITPRRGEKRESDGGNDIPPKIARALMAMERRRYNPDEGKLFELTDDQGQVHIFEERTDYEHWMRRLGRIQNAGPIFHPRARPTPLSAQAGLMPFGQPYNAMAHATYVLANATAAAQAALPYYAPQMMPQIHNPGTAGGTAMGVIPPPAATAPTAASAPPPVAAAAPTVAAPATALTAPTAAPLPPPPPAADAPASAPPPPPPPPPPMAPPPPPPPSGVPTPSPPTGMPTGPPPPIPGGAPPSSLGLPSPPTKPPPPIPGTAPWIHPLAVGLPPPPPPPVVVPTLPPTPATAAAPAAPPPTPPVPVPTPIGGAPPPPPPAPPTAPPPAAAAGAPPVPVDPERANLMLAIQNASKPKPKDPMAEYEKEMARVTALNARRAETGLEPLDLPTAPGVVPPKKLEGAAKSMAQLIKEKQAAMKKGIQGDDSDEEDDDDDEWPADGTSAAGAPAKGLAPLPGTTSAV